MQIWFRRPIAVLIALTLQCGWLFAFETDQYNLPPIALADIGEEVTEYTRENIAAAIEKINAEIELRQSCLDKNAAKPRGCSSPRTDRERLDYLRSDLAVARQVYKRLGYGIIAFARAGTWMDRHEFKAKPARYKTSYSNSIFLYLPTDYLTISPTVNMYGVSFGTDKIAHFFQQGYQYYMIRNRAAKKGSSSAAAVKKAVDWGKMTERTYYGTLVGGVYSNADLVSNYVGMRFYQGLTKPISIADKVRPATLILSNGIWAFNDNAQIDETLLKPFFSDHLNEALNPSLFIPGLRSSIRSIVKKKSCPQWRAAYRTRSKEDYENLTSSLSLWNGEDYGFKNSDKFVTIAKTCFDGSNEEKIASAL